MNTNDKITVIEDYCTVCRGPCENKDADDYDHLHQDLERVVQVWSERGANPTAVWAMLVSVVLSTAAESGMTWAEVKEALHSAWNQGVKEMTDDAP